MSEERSATISVGFRAAAASLHWAAVSGSQACVVLEDSGVFRVPATGDESGGLAYLRDRANHLLRQFAPLAVSLRFAEHSGPGGRKDSDRKRARIEGVVMELAFSNGVPVSVGPLQQMALRLGEKNAKAAKELLASDEVRKLDWSSIKDKSRREAILTAISVLPVDS